MCSVEGILASSCRRFRPLELSQTPRSSAANVDWRIRLPMLSLPSTASTAFPQCKSNTADEPIDKVGEWSLRSPLIYNTQRYVMVDNYIPLCHNILSIVTRPYLLGWKGLGTRLILYIHKVNALSKVGLNAWRIACNFSQYDKKL